MTGRRDTDANKQPRNVSVRRCGMVVGGALSAFVTAAAMATGSAAPAKADFEDLLDPIIQPLLTSFTDAVSVFDPAAAVDITSWTDTLLSGLSSADLALPAAAEPASTAAAAAVEPAATAPTTADIPITIGEDTEPTVATTVDGTSTPLLVDTGSSGLVVPITALEGSKSELSELLSLGAPSGISESGFGGVDYIYLTYDNVSVDYAGGVDTTAPIEVEVYSYDPGSFSSLFTNDTFQNFLKDNDVSGILGIGNDVSGSAGTSPLEAAGYTGVTIDLPQSELIIGDATNPGTAIDTALTSTGSTVSGLTETVTTSTGGAVGTGTVSDDLDSGGVYGTIPTSISSSTLAQGDVVTVSDNGKELYSYIVGTDTLKQSESPTVTSGTSIDSGVIPFENNPIFIDYTAGTISIDEPLS